MQKKNDASLLRATKCLRGLPVTIQLGLGSTEEKNLTKPLKTGHKAKDDHHREETEGKNFLTLSRRALLGSLQLGKNGRQGCNGAQTTPKHGVAGKKKKDQQGVSRGELPSLPDSSAREIA